MKVELWLIVSIQLKNTYLLVYTPVRILTLASFVNTLYDIYLMIMMMMMMMMMMIKS